MVVLPSAVMRLSMRVRRLALWVASALMVVCTSGVVNAADTGTLSGAIFDPSGSPIVDAVVKLTGARLPVGRTVQSDANGHYQFEYVPPGDYTLEIEKAGAGRVTRTAVVTVGRDTQVDAILGQSVTEALTVVAAVPLVDTRSTEVNFNVNADTINSLPLERAYRGLFQLIPGVADNRSTIGPAAGGSRQDNTYLIDGANIGNPLFGYLGTDVNELDIAEVNLKRAGISAEFGRASGTVTNAVSRSGTNTFSGIARIDWLSEGLVGAYELPESLTAAGIKPGTFRDAVLTTELSPAIGIGGPIVKDHAFFYGSARSYRQAKWDRVNRVGTPLPDDVRSGHELYAKFSATPSAAHQLTASYRHRPNTVDNAGLNSDYAPSVAVTSDNGSGVATTEWAWFMAPRRSMNLRYLYVDEQNHDVPVTDLGYLPSPFNPNNLSAMGQYTDPAQANLIVGAKDFATEQNYRRHEVRGTVTQFFDLGPTSHALKGGGGYEFGEESLNRLVNGWGNIVNVTVSGTAALRARYYTRQPPQLGQSRSSSLFVQDEITIGNRVTANVGVLASRDLFSQVVDGSNGCPSTVLLKGGAAIYRSEQDTCDFLTFGFGEEIQPRLGVSYQVRERQGDKAYANWGRYYNLDQKSSSRSLAPSRVFQTETIFDLNGNVLSSGPLASTTGKLIDPDIKPIYTDEYLVGYATPFRGIYSLDLFFMARDMKRFIEDVPSRINSSAQTGGPYAAANLPCTRFASCQNADAKRNYKAMTVAVHRQLANQWMGDANYTWSRFEGNFDIDYATTVVFNTSSFIQDAPGAYVEDPNRFGPLFEDRPHVLKLMSSYQVTPRLMASGYLRVQSGTPWAARGRDAGGGVLNFLEPSGSHRNPTWTNLDLMASYRIPLRASASLSLEARVLNVFDNQTQLATDAQKFLDLRTLTVPPYIDAYQQPNPFYGFGNSFAPPRRLYLSATAMF